MSLLKKSLIVLMVSLFCLSAHAHHVLGRPAYSLNEDSNTPPSMAIETQLGEYYITYMVFPAFPKPNEAGRLNLYATRIDNGLVFNGQVDFLVLDDSWFGDSKMEMLGQQSIDDGVFRQGFMFKKNGDYLIRARFEHNGEPYEIDFPLQVGSPASIGPIGLTVALLLLILLGVNLLQKKRIKRAKLQQGLAHP